MKNMTMSERLMGMSDAVWARHANPLSGWSRLSVLPLFVLFVWSRVWLGWWCLAPISLVLLWVWWNPRAFPPTRNLDNWMSKSVLDERIWIARGARPVPESHRRVPAALLAVSTFGLMPLAWGLWSLSAWPTLTGMVLLIGAKLWFLDRMVWVFQDSGGFRAARPQP